MPNQNITACYFPTKVLLIDDKKRYMMGLKSKLNKANASYTMHSDSVEVLNYLQNDYKYSPFLDRCINRPEEDERDHRSIDVDINAIRNEIYKPNRFDEISVVIVDHEMPALTGLEMCKQLGSTPYKKLMLTAEVEDEKAIQAFNDGLIDKFMVKSADNFYNVLNNTICNLQKDYFREQSLLIINSITQETEFQDSSCLNDPVFIKFFNELCAEHDFCEYYLTNANGGFMFLDVNGNPSWLVVKDEEAMRASQFAAEMASQKVSDSVMKALVNRETIVYLHDHVDYTIDPGNWEATGKLHPAKRLEGGKQLYYYAYINNPKAYDIQPNKIVSYRSYLDSSN